jgi:hypothetical protein
MNLRSFVNWLSDGVPVPLGSMVESPPSESDRRLFVAYPPGMHTGKAESQWVATQALYLAAHGDCWHAIPWRLLHNRYTRPSSLQKLLRRAEMIAPDFSAIEEKPVVFNLGKPPAAGQMIHELLIGMKHLVANGLVEIRRVGAEDFVCVTAMLVACAVTNDRPMTLERHLDPFGLRHAKN